MFRQCDVPSCSVAAEGAYDKFYIHIGYSFVLPSKQVITESMLLYTATRSGYSGVSTTSDTCGRKSTLITVPFPAPVSLLPYKICSFPPIRDTRYPHNIFFAMLFLPETSIQLQSCIILLFIEPIVHTAFDVISFAEPFINDSVFDGPLPHCGDTFPTDFGFKSTRRVRRCSANQRTGAVRLDVAFSDAS